MSLTGGIDESFKQLGKDLGRDRIIINGHRIWGGDYLREQSGAAAHADVLNAVLEKSIETARAVLIVAGG